MKFSILLILVEKYSCNKNKIERSADLREYLALFICDVSAELGHSQTAIQKKKKLKYGSFALIKLVIRLSENLYKYIYIYIICLHKTNKNKNIKTH